MKEGECDGLATCTANRFSTVQITVQYRCVFVLLFGWYLLWLDDNFIIICQHLHVCGLFSYMVSSSHVHCIN